MCFPYVVILFTDHKTSLRIHFLIFKDCNYNCTAFTTKVLSLPYIQHSHKIYIYIFYIYSIPKTIQYWSSLDALYFSVTVNVKSNILQYMLLVLDSGYHQLWGKIIIIMLLHWYLIRLSHKMESQDYSLLYCMLVC